MAADGSTAQILASGSQDLAALAGLFATEGVERNALAGHLGYGAVISAGVSILGILGLIKSSVKLSLGLERCRKSGFTIDSLRGFFGYEPHETPVVGRMVRCDLVDVEFRVEQESVVFSKIPKYFDTDTRPIVNVGSQDPESFEGKTAIIDGNWRHETTVLQSSWFVASVAFLGTGVTAWLLLIVRANMSWEFWFATAGLHASLLVLVGVPLWHSFQLVKPSKFLSEEKIRLLLGAQEDLSAAGKRLSFMQIHVNPGNGYANFFHGEIGFVNTWSFKLCMLFFSAICAVSYVCQYTVLKGADSRHAAAWIAAQAALALFRVLFWLWDPEFDDPKVERPNYTPIAKDYSDKFGPMTFVRKLPTLANQQIPLWVWNFLSKTSVTEIIRQAREQNADYISRNTKQIFVLGMDPSDLFSDIRRDPALRLERPFKWRIFLHLDHHKIVYPIIYVARQPAQPFEREVEFWAPLERDLGNESPNKTVRFEGGGSMPILPYKDRMYFEGRKIDGIGDLSLVREHFEQPFFRWGFKSQLIEPKMVQELKDFATDVYSLEEYPVECSALVNSVLSSLLQGRYPLSHRIKKAIYGTLPRLRKYWNYTIYGPPHLVFNAIDKIRDPIARNPNSFFRRSRRPRPQDGEVVDISDAC